MLEQCGRAAWPVRRQRPPLSPQHPQGSPAPRLLGAEAHPVAQGWTTGIGVYAEMLPCNSGSTTVGYRSLQRQVLLGFLT